jgi:hypothetical protein
LRRLKELKEEEEDVCAIIERSEGKDHCGKRRGSESCAAGEGVAGERKYDNALAGVVSGDGKR